MGQTSQKKAHSQRLPTHSQSESSSCNSTSDSSESDSTSESESSTDSRCSLKAKSGNARNSSQTSDDEESLESSDSESESESTENPGQASSVEYSSNPESGSEHESSSTLKPNQASGDEDTSESESDSAKSGSNTKIRENKHVKPTCAEVSNDKDSTSRSKLVPRGKKAGGRCLEQDEVLNDFEDEYPADTEDADLADTEDDTSAVSEELSSEEEAEEVEGEEEEHEEEEEEEEEEDEDEEEEKSPTRSAALRVGASRGRKRSASCLSSNSDHVRNIPKPCKKAARGELSDRQIEEQTKSEMLAAGYRKALEREVAKKLHPSSNGAPTATFSGVQPPPRIKIEDTSSSAYSLREISIQEFYSECFNHVREFLLKRNYANPVVLANLKESGITKYELQSMRGLNQSVLISRFTSLLSDECRKPAQLESLAFAVFSASSAEWNSLNDFLIPVQ